MKLASRAGRMRVAKPVVVDRTTVEYELSCDAGVSEYFSREKMFVTYDVDIGGVPESLLLIPFIATLAPIAWALGAELDLPCTDLTFVQALGEIRQAFRRLHPDLDWSGEIQADEIVDTSGSYRGRGHAILFSGGVDSVTSVVVHREGRPRLVIVWGADLGLAQHRLWKQVSAANRTFAQRRSSDMSFIKTNFRTFFNSYQLKARFAEEFPNWYSAFQQGLGLVGLCGPLSYVHELGSIYIPSTHTADFAKPWGSHPEIDNRIRWASTRAIHDGYELSRQRKLQVLAKYIRETDPNLSLRVCWGKGVNCSQCEKCCVTMLGLALEGLDPNDHGFRFGSDTLSHMREQLENGRFNVSDTLVWILAEIQKQPISGADTLKFVELEEFLTWFHGAPLEGFKEKSERSVRKAVKGFLEKSPEPIGRSLRKTMGHPFP